MNAWSIAATVLVAVGCYGSIMVATARWYYIHRRSRVIEQKFDYYDRVGYFKNDDAKRLKNSIEYFNENDKADANGVAWIVGIFWFILLPCMAIDGLLSRLFRHLNSKVINNGKISELERRLEAERQLAQVRKRNAELERELGIGVD